MEIPGSVKQVLIVHRPTAISPRTSYICEEINLDRLAG